MDMADPWGVGSQSARSEQPRGVAVSPGLWPEPTPDRSLLGAGRTVLVAVLLGASFHIALQTLPVEGTGSAFVNAAVLTGVVAVLGLRSVPLRVVVLSYAFIGAGVMGALGTLGDGGVTGSARVLGWVAFVVSALVLCPAPFPRRSAPGSGSDAVSSVAGTGDGAGPSALIRAVVAVVAVVAATVLLVGPWAAQRASLKSSDGDPPDALDSGADNALSFQSRLDMTRRPRLSDAVVMTVRSDLVSFWRTATYDRWDTTTWTNSDLDTYRHLGPDGVLTPPPDDLAAVGGRPSTQEFRLESRYASALPLAPSAVHVDSSDELVELSDGSLVAPDALGRGAAYTVTSRQVPVTAEELSGIRGEIPASVRDRYATEAPTTQRVRELATRIVRDAGATSEHARVRALERWMSSNLSYSIDAPLAPAGVDVVDDFLFRSKVGWCEQIASSLVVMLRQVGVPARLAVGFAPGSRDGGSGRFVVRERDAHAWAEVWFPEVGWVPFDPTATVPLAGDSEASMSPLPVGAAQLAGVLLFVALVSVLAVPLARRLHQWRDRRRTRRQNRRLAAQRWDVRVEHELEELGRELGRPRKPAETVSAHARELAAVSGRPELAEQGRAVDLHRYAPPTADGHDR